MPELSSPAAFIAVFRDHAASDGTMNFARFVELALYHPAVGYYRRSRDRVGYGGDTDFFTASTSGAIFGELVVAASVKLLGERALQDFIFVEIGAESGGGVLTGVAHPFGAARVLKTGEPLHLSGACVVFSNELFDAQPFRRFRFRDGAWRELGVALRADDTFVETELPPPITTDHISLPADCPDGYVIDAPLAATELISSIAMQAWTGLFVACDYGKSWQELSEATPAGTARAYFRHTQSNDLLARPGEQDLTCHVCWDWLREALQSRGFTDPRIESQEAFFVRHAGAAVEAISTAEAARFSQRKRALMQLLHPSHLGQKFQVLHAVR